MKAGGIRRCLALLAVAGATLAGKASAQALTGDVIFGVTWASYESERLRASLLGGGDAWFPLWSGGRFSPTLGGGVAIPLASFLKVRTEALLVRKGLTGPEAGLDEIYLELPVLLRIEMPWKDQVKFRGSAGIAPAVEVRCSATVASQPADCEDFRSEGGDIGNLFAVGFGPIPFAGWSIMPEARLVLGGADLLSSRPREKARHKTFSILFAVSR